MGEELSPYSSQRAELFVQDGCLLGGSCVVVPPPEHKNILAELHEAHPGMVHMKYLARMSAWWHGIDADTLY